MRMQWWMGAGMAALLTLNGAVLAQDDAPLLFVTDGDLYAWTLDNAANQLTSTLEIEDAAVSPQQTNLVLLSAQAQIAVDATANGMGIGGGALPSDIWLYNRETGSLQQLSFQPQGASFFVEGKADLAEVAGSIVWSEDGRYFAWSELTYQDNINPDETHRVVIYDLSTGQATTFDPNLPPQYGVTMPVELFWRENHLVVVSREYRNQAEQMTLRVFNPEGIEERAIELPSEDTRWSMANFTLTDNGQPYWGTFYTDGMLLLANLDTGAVITEFRLPQRVSLGGSEVVLQAVADGGMAGFALQGPSGWVDLPAHTQLDTLAFSPDGRSAAVFNYDEADTWLNVFGAGEQRLGATPLTGDRHSFTAVQWGVSEWRLDTPSVPPTYEMNLCGGVTSQLAEGDLAIVLPGSANNLRSQPTTSGALLGAIPAGGGAFVTGAAVCAGDIWWVPVDYNGLTGWTAESQAGTYYLAARTGE